MKTLACISTLIGLLGSSAYASGTWNLTTDWQNDTNPNGAWSYGQINGTVFSQLAWNNLTGTYGDGAGFDGAFVYQNGLSVPAFGIGPGQISLESDWGSAAAQWTAPANGVYDITVAIGGTTATEGGGYGNNFAYNAGLNINGSSPAGSFLDNVMSWDVNDVYLQAGQSVTAYVINPGYADGGNNQTEFTVTAVPEPTTIISGMLMLLPFGASTLRILRRNRAA